MDWVWMEHPDLPEQPIRCASTAVTFHEASGWKRTPPPPGELITPDQFIERYGYDPRK